jgi:hypothetical protein
MPVPPEPLTYIYTYTDTAPTRCPYCTGTTASPAVHNFFLFFCALERRVAGME